MSLKFNYPKIRSHLHPRIHFPLNELSSSQLAWAPMKNSWTIYSQWWNHPHFFDFIKWIEDKNIGNQHNLDPLSFARKHIGEAIELYWLQKVRKDATANFRGTMEMTIIKGIANEFWGILYPFKMTNRKQWMHQFWSNVHCEQRLVSG